MDGYVIFDGRCVSADEATVSVFDLGFLRGMGAFESLRTYNGHPFALSDHLERLWVSTAAFAVDPCLDEPAARAAIAELYARNDHRDMRVNLVVTPGVAQDSLLGSNTPSVLIIGRPHQDQAASMRETGIHGVTFHGERLLPRLKTTTYLSGHRGQRKAAAHNAQEAFYVNESGYITEGVTSNLLLCRDGSVIVPEADKLEGITQHHILRLARAEGMSVSQNPIRPADVIAADEAWICSSIREMIPLVTLDGQAIGSGQPGNITKRLAARFHAYCRESAAADADAR